MNPTERIFCWTAPALLAATAPAAAQVYLTEAQALTAIFGREAQFERQEKRLAPEDRQKLEAASGLRFPEPAFTFFLARQKDRLGGYAVALDEIGKSEPISFMVGMSPEGKITEVVVMVFRESRGGEVREPRFLRQFRGKSVGDPIRIHQDIVNYTGATLSSKAIARGVKRALLLGEHFYRRDRIPQPQAGALIVPALPGAIAEARAVKLYRQARCRMGTLAEIRVWAETARAAADAFDAGFRELERIESVFSLHREESELARVNREAGARPIEVSQEFWRLTRLAARQARHSAGAFDITLSPLSRLWGFGPPPAHEPRVPSPSEIGAARARVGMEKVKLDPRARRIRFLADGMELDFGGLAKGYAAERAARLLAKYGARAALVNLGRSSLSAASDPALRDAGLVPDQSKHWVVAIADPRDAVRSVLFFELMDGWSVSTSGTYEQHCALDGRTQSHVLDPRTGWPIAGQRSATVVARSGARGEALSKPLLIDGARATAVRGLRRTDWAHVEVSADGQLLLEQKFWHSTLLPAV